MFDDVATLVDIYPLCAEKPTLWVGDFDDAILKIVYPLPFARHDDLALTVDEANPLVEVPNGRNTAPELPDITPLSGDDLIA